MTDDELKKITKLMKCGQNELGLQLALGAGMSIEEIVEKCICENHLWLKDGHYWKYFINNDYIMHYYQDICLFYPQQLSMHTDEKLNRRRVISSN